MAASGCEEAELMDEVIGIWDTNNSPLSLGGLLILAEELKMQTLVHQAKSVAIGIVGDCASSLLPGQLPQNGEPLVLLSREACQGSVLLSLLLDLESINVCYLCPSLEELQRYLQARPKRYILWPQLDEHHLISHRDSSTIFAQKFFAERGFIPHLSCKTDLLRWAASFIAQYVAPSLPVVVHLKNNPNLKGCSNANFKSWYNFFLSCYGQYDVKFILIGNEPIDPQITQLPNVLVARDCESYLSRDLALVETSYIFMGMSSGPSIMALFCDIPYVIYKNPDHDVEEMALQLGTNNRLLFATPVQKFLRIFETPQGLMTEFADLHAHINRSDWETRLARWD
jgi:hypothetical protein